VCPRPQLRRLSKQSRYTFRRLLVRPGEQVGVGLQHDGGVVAQSCGDDVNGHALRQREGRRRVAENVQGARR
jgi:hypothetical protein